MFIKTSYTVKRNSEGVTYKNCKKQNDYLFLYLCQLKNCKQQTKKMTNEQYKTLLERVASFGRYL